MSFNAAKSAIFKSYYFISYSILTQYHNFTIRASSIFFYDQKSDFLISMSNVLKTAHRN